MKSITQRATLFFIVIAACVAWSAPAHAYIDGGSLSMLFQMLVAGSLGAIVTARMWWGQVKAFLLRFKKDSPVDE